MSKQQQEQKQSDQKRRSNAGIDNADVRRNDWSDVDRSMPETNDVGDAVSEGSLRDASGEGTGGVGDTNDDVLESTEAEIRKHKHIHQGTNAYTGGGADNGSSL